MSATRIPPSKSRDTLARSMYTAFFHSRSNVCGSRATDSLNPLDLPIYDRSLFYFEQFSNWAAATAFSSDSPNNRAMTRDGRLDRSDREPSNCIAMFGESLP